MTPTLLVLLLLATCVYSLALFLQRFIFSPISHLPGPKLAAFTFWYEFYYDVICSGRFTWKIQQLHQQYGPIIRINPEEVHIDDPGFYDEVYVGPSRRTDKWHWSAKMFGTSDAAVGTVDHDLHRLRRGALNPFFSKRSVVGLEPVIQANVLKLRARLKAFAGTGEPVNLSDAYACLSADVIGSYAFGKSYDFLDHPTFDPGWRSFMMQLSAGTMLMKQFGWAYNLLECLPPSLVAMLHPLTRQLFDLRQWIERQIKAAQSEHSKSVKNDKSRTIFHDLLASSLPARELSLHRLTDEALTIVGAGTVTTAHTLSIITYHLLSSKEKLERARRELHSLFLERPTWNQLEQLPYLSACITEGLRLSYGVSHRLQRVSPDVELCYRDATDGRSWTIPKGTPISMTQMFIHNDPVLFADPLQFRPERWLASTEPNPTTLRKWFMPFSRGTRACVGMNLAYAELFLATAALFTPVDLGGLDMALFETDYSDVEVKHDLFNPSPRLDSKGIRVIVQE